MPEDPEDAFLVAHARRFGRSNPERITTPFLLEQVRTGETSFRAMQARGVTPRFRRRGSPAWTFDRYGQARVALPDGTVLAIAGEHEDYYDPDFCIYNDVTVFRPDGTIDVYAYPRDVFPPTDFHTATLVGDQVYIVGNVGYQDDRRKISGTPVFKLDIQTLAISLVLTAGQAPDRLYRHFARLSPDAHALEFWSGYVEPPSSNPDEQLLNPHLWQLDLRTHAWRNVGHPKPALPPGLTLPSPWEPLGEDDSIGRSVTFRREIPPGHPLFALPAQAVATHGSFGPTLFALLDGTSRYAAAELTFVGRQDFPLTRIFDSLGDALTADLSLPLLPPPQ